MTKTTSQDPSAAPGESLVGLNVGQQKQHRVDGYVASIKIILFLVSFLGSAQTSFCKDVVLAGIFVVSLPDTAKEQHKNLRPDSHPDKDLPRYSDASFQLSVFRWPNIKPCLPLKQIPEEWTKNKEWASVSNISEAKTDSGIPYVTFNTRIIRDNRPPFDSVMTVLRAPNGEALMFQMTGEVKSINAILKSIRNK